MLSQVSHLHDVHTYMSNTKKQRCGEAEVFGEDNCKSMRWLVEMIDGEILH